MRSPTIPSKNKVHACRKICILPQTRHFKEFIDERAHRQMNDLDSSTTNDHNSDQNCEQIPTYGTECFERTGCLKR